MARWPHGELAEPHAAQRFVLVGGPRAERTLPREVQQLRRALAQPQAREPDSGQWTGPQRRVGRCGAIGQSFFLKYAATDPSYPDDSYRRRASGRW
jgi:hypothetical protein